MVNDEVTCESWEVIKLDWIELVIIVDSESEVPLIELIVRVEPVSEVK
jgi:RNA polymerase subunit RPABC4/transcription elongation factor Spt4